jgi:ADP-ribose pyrophosphatase YjhB (NUDIX family)
MTYFIKLIIKFSLLTAILTGCSSKIKSAEMRPVLTVAGIIHVCPENKITLIERGKNPKGLAMFGGHVEHEDPVTAFERELFEELNITDISNLKFIGVHGNPGRDPRQHSVEITFTATTNQTPKAGSDAKKANLYTIEKLNKVLNEEHFAFDHVTIIRNYLKNIATCNPCKKQCNVGLQPIQYLNSFITPIKTFQEISAKTDSETLVLLDIDDTIFRSTSHYGAGEFFAQMVDDEVLKSNCTKSQAKLKVYDRWIKSQLNISTKLIDNKIHKFIKLAKTNNATVIAFTARQPRIAEITYNQIKKHNIYFDQLPGFTFKEFYRNQIFPDEKWCEDEKNIKICNTTKSKKYDDSQALFYKGILFAHDLNKKGKIFTDFYKKLSAYEKRKFKKIIFVDDKLYNLKSLEEAASGLNLEFYGYHIENNFPHDYKLAMKEEEAKYNF